MEMKGALLPLAVHAVVTALHVLLPGVWVDGYVVGRDGKPLRYRLNGALVLAVSVAAAVAACQYLSLDATVLYRYRWEAAGGASVLGLIFTCVMVFGAPLPPSDDADLAVVGARRTRPVDRAAEYRRRPLPAWLFFGRQGNPQWLGGRIDAKMWLYLVGAVLLALNALSALAHRRARSDVSAPDAGVAQMATGTALLVFFTFEYLCGELVHLYTYDFFAERVAFKLGWGCLCFYPYFYAVGPFTAAGCDVPSAADASAVSPVVGAVIFTAGWVLSRFANLQKWRFKVAPRQPFLGFMPQRALQETAPGNYAVTSAPDPAKPALLLSHFWALSRHINYLGEILEASGIALCCSLSCGPHDTLGRALPWLYPLYYVALLVPRQFADDDRCGAKYGGLWVEYCRRVPSRIVPGIL